MFVCVCVCVFCFLCVCFAVVMFVVVVFDLFFCVFNTGYAPFIRKTKTVVCHVMFLIVCVFVLIKCDVPSSEKQKTKYVDVSCCFLLMQCAFPSF